MGDSIKDNLKLKNEEYTPTEHVTKKKLWRENQIKTEENIPAQHITSQKLWRENQIKILYGSGRPIFNCFKETNHIYYKNTQGTYIGSYY